MTEFSNYINNPKKNYKKLLKNKKIETINYKKITNTYPINIYIIKQILYDHHQAK